MRKPIAVSIRPMSMLLTESERDGSVAWASATGVFLSVSEPKPSLLEFPLGDSSA